MSVGGLGLAGLSPPAVIIQQPLVGRQGSRWLLRAGLDARLDHFSAARRCAQPAPRKAHGTGICHRNLSA